MKILLAAVLLATATGSEAAGKAAPEAIPDVSGLVSYTLKSGTEGILPPMMSAMLGIGMRGYTTKSLRRSTKESSQMTRGFQVVYSTGASAPEVTALLFILAPGRPASGGVFTDGTIYKAKSDGTLLSAMVQKPKGGQMVLTAVDSTAPKVRRAYIAEVKYFVKFAAQESSAAEKRAAAEKHAAAEKPVAAEKPQKPQ